MRSLWVFLAVSVLAAGCNCGKKPPAQSQLHEGEPCENDERCVTGLCDAAPGFSPVCVRRCGDGCNPTEVCVQLTPNRFACQPDQRKLCAPCVADVDCPYPSDKCIVVNGEDVCGRDCAFDQNCPTGYRCVNGLGVDGLPKVQQCVPTVASCACLARGDFQQACTTTNDAGTCSGIKQCDLVSNSVVCDAPQAGVETCNGLDDNCNGDDRRRPDDRDLRRRRVPAHHLLVRRRRRGQLHARARPSPSCATASTTTATARSTTASTPPRRSPAAARAAGSACSPTPPRAATWACAGCSPATWASATATTSIPTAASRTRAPTR